ncbi:MAG: hypothetical protein U0325_27360 [Polyangiales bacterium]
MSTAPTLSRFVGDLVDDVRDALLALAGVERTAGFALQRHEGGAVAQLTVALPDGELTLEAFDAALRRDAWFSHRAPRVVVPRRRRPRPLRATRGRGAAARRCASG